MTNWFYNFHGCFDFTRIHVQCTSTSDSVCPMPQSGTANRKTVYLFMKNFEFKRCLNVLGLNVRQILDKSLLVDVLDVHELFLLSITIFILWIVVNISMWFSSESNFWRSICDQTVVVLIYYGINYYSLMREFLPSLCLYIHYVCCVYEFRVDKWMMDTVHKKENLVCYHIDGFSLDYNSYDECNSYRNWQDWNYMTGWNILSASEYTCFSFPFRCIILLIKC